jgi:pathogenesis-related protein 1
MRAFIFSLVLVGCSSSSGKGLSSASSGGAGTGTKAPTAEMQAMLNAHNSARATGAAPEPTTKLNDLAWSDSDAEVAQAYADQCVFEHNKGRGERGENLFAATASTDPGAVVQAWADEVTDYNYGTNKCASGKMCGHYTQLMWAQTTHVGCAKKACSADGSPFPGRSWEIWVCNYSPPGNYVGEKPY